MPVLVALVGLILTAGYWAWRIRAAKEALDSVADMAGDVLSAARRLGFRHQANMHPIDSINDPQIAVAAVGLAFLDLAAMPTSEQVQNLKFSLAQQLNVSDAKADEMMIVGRWLVNECKTADAAINRLTKRLYRMDQKGFSGLLPVLRQAAQDTTLTPRQRDALDDIARIMRLT